VAGIKDFKKVGNANDDVSKLQERLQEFFVPLVNNPMLDGLLLTNINVGTSETKVEHQLRRAPIGWIIVNKSANADVWQSSGALNTAFLNLQASAPVTISLWVF
jgi:hypothetical protein